MDITFKLDSMYSKLFSNIVSVKSAQLISTVSNNSDGAFQLNDPGQVTKTEFIIENKQLATDDNYKTMIIRLAILYVDALKASEDFEWGYEYFSVIKHEMIKEILKSGTRYNQMTFIRPGKDSSVFRDMENFAAVEIRLYTTKEIEDTNEITG